jgi:uncharacterized protein YuzE
MKITYFEDTDTLLVEFTQGLAEDARDLDEQTLGEYDSKGNLLSLTLEHASNRVDLENFSYGTRHDKHDLKDTATH